MLEVLLNLALQARVRTLLKVKALLKAKGRILLNSVPQARVRTLPKAKVKMLLKARMLLKAKALPLKVKTLLNPKTKTHPPAKHKLVPHLRLRKAVPDPQPEMLILRLRMLRRKSRLAFALLNVRSILTVCVV